MCCPAMAVICYLALGSPGTLRWLTGMSLLNNDRKLDIL